MATFPTISFKPLLDPFTYKPTTMNYEGQYSGGYKVTRALNNRSLNTFNITYNRVDSTTKSTLETFYYTTCHGSAVIFTMNNPLTGTNENYRFVNDSYDAKPEPGNKYTISFAVEQV